MIQCCNKSTLSFLTVKVLYEILRYKLIFTIAYRILIFNMTLIKSISGIRGTIGGKPGEALTPIDVVKFTAAFGKILLQKTGSKKIVVGRDARLSGEMVSNLVVGTLQGIG